VLDLVAKLDASGLEDAEIVVGDVSVRVSKSVLPNNAHESPRHAPARSVDPDPTPAVSATEATPAPAPDTSADPAGSAVTAPMLGVLYLRPSPDADPFVTPGDAVGPDTTVAIIEVMKMMNPVTAGTAGTLLEVCVQAGQLVEHGDVLMRIQADG
jgi:acetyl-CoA carboxylase biotin carboxyl carrier protein